MFEQLANQAIRPVGRHPTGARFDGPHHVGVTLDSPGPDGQAHGRRVIVDLRAEVLGCDADLVAAGGLGEIDPLLLKCDEGGVLADSGLASQPGCVANKQGRG
jgi:hypothetical protein